jgi:hypothetical protein
MRSNLEIASRALGVDLVSPYRIEHQGRQAWCLGYLPHFGGVNGMVVDVAGLEAEEFEREVVFLARSRGLYFSLLHPGTYLAPKEEEYVEAFTDWGYFGPLDKQPRWLNFSNNMT